MKIIKKIILTIIAILFSFKLSSQEKKHEIYLTGMGGISSLTYSLSSGNSDSKLKFGGSFGIGYNYFLSKNWALGTGVELSFVNADGEFKNISDKYNTIDEGNKEFEFAYSIRSVKEKQKIKYLNIPIMAQFLKSASGGFYIAFGGKIGLLLKKEYTTAFSDLSTRAYYPDIDLIIDGESESNGIGNFERLYKKDDLDLKLSFFLSAEVGNKWNFSDKLGLYAGIYCDYGLNNIQKFNNHTSLLEFDSQNKFPLTANSILSSKYNEGNKYIAEKVHPISFGLKLKFAFAINH